MPIFDGNCVGYALHKSVKSILSKNNNNWYKKSEDFEVLHYIQSAMVWRVVNWKASCTRVWRASRGQRQLERQWLERQCQSGRQSEQLECWQPGLLSKLLSFSRHLFGGSFVSSPFFQPPSCLPISSSF